MKRKMKQILGILLAVSMLLGMTAIPAAAETASESYSMTATYYPSSKDVYRCDIGTGNSIPSVSKNTITIYACSGNKIVSAQSSNPSVASVSTATSGDSSDKFFTLTANVKKAGTTVITFKFLVKSDLTNENITYTITTTLNVKKYVNPIKSVTLGKKTYSSKVFKSKGNLTLKYSDYVNKKILPSVKLKSGWKLTSINFYSSKIGYETNYYNGKYISKSGMKVSGGKGCYFALDVQNKKTKQTEKITIYFK